MSEYKNNIWVNLVVLLVVSIITAGLSALLVTYFEEIRRVIPALMMIICLFGIGLGFLFFRKHNAKQRIRGLIVVVANYLLIITSAFLYSIGFVWWLALFFFLIVLISINNEVASDVESLCLLHTNTLFSVPMSTTFEGLYYANNISADWGTLYLTIFMGVTYAAVGFVFSAIALLLGNAKYNKT